MDLELQGKRALVFGATGGLGGAIADALAAEGAVVALGGRDGARLKAAASEISKKHRVRALACEFDLSAPDQLEKALQGVEEQLNGIDILVNNTPGPPPGSVAGVSAEEWRKQFETMVISVIRITDRLIGGMRARKWGRVLTIASSGPVQPIPNLGVSNTVRAALLGWNKTLSSEVARDGVTVNLVIPGRIHTPRVDQLDAAAAKSRGVDVAQVVADSIAGIPARRYGRPQEFAAAVTFLASERASYITGSKIRIDGGMIRSI